MILKEDLKEIGKTIKPHGIKGEILCEFTFVLDDGQMEYLIVEEDGIFVPFFIDNIRGKSQFTAFVLLSGVDDEKTAKQMCGKTIFTDKKIEDSIDSENIMMSFLIGFRIVDENYGEIGEITAIDESTINTLFVVTDRLIPAQEEFISNIDSKKKIIYTSLPEGIMDI